MTTKPTRKFSIIFFAVIIIFSLISWITSELMKQQGLGFSYTSEVSEFYFCYGAGKDGKPVQIAESVSARNVKDIDVCGFLTTDGRKSDITVLIYKQPDSAPIYYTMSEKFMPGYFYLPMKDIITSSGEYRADVFYAHRVIATTKIQVSE